MPTMEILGHGLAFTPRVDGPTVFWQTLPPPGSQLPRMLNVGFRDHDGFRWGTVIPRPTATPNLPPEVKLVKLGATGASMLLNNADHPSQIVDVSEGENGGTWWIRTALSERLSVDVAWVPLFFLETTPPGALWAFELHGPLEDVSVLAGGGGIGQVLQAFDTVPPGTLVIVRGPLPPVAETAETLIGRMPPGTELVDRGQIDGIEWIDASSRGENGHTLQRHYICDVGANESIVVTGQSAPYGMDPVRDYAELIATKLDVIRD